MRFRLRSLLILVAVLALLMRAGMTRRRWRSYRQKAAYHARMEGQAVTGRQARLLAAELARQQHLERRGRQRHRCHRYPGRNRLLEDRLYVS